MNLITKHTDYAARALVYLARSGGRLVPSREIAEQEGIPLAFLRRILRELAQEGLIDTREGAAGGAKLAVDPRKIELTRLIEIYQGKISLVECIFRRRLCPNRDHCVLRPRLMKIEELVLSELAGITIGGLVKDIEEQNDEKKNN
jgi:Rrf2 family protein